LTVFAKFYAHRALFKNEPFLTGRLDFGVWILDFGSWILDLGFWILDLGFWILDFGSWILEFGFWILDQFSLRSSCGGPKRPRLDFGFWILGLD